MKSLSTRSFQSTEKFQVRRDKIEVLTRRQKIGERGGKPEEGDLRSVVQGPGTLEVWCRENT